MKLIRYGEPGRECPGLLDSDGRTRELSGVIDDITGATLGDESLKRLQLIDPRSLPLAEAGARTGPCVANVGKVICIGLNYSDHAAESGMPVPEEPIVFLKATTAICGAYDPVILPPGSKKSDWEVELGVVVGKKAQYVNEDEAFEYVAGYCAVNDLSERHYQLERCGQWVKGKSCDTFCPIGPWLVTADEIPDPQSLKLWLEVNGRCCQKGSTATMVFGVKRLVSYLSQFMTLMPGDIISTGTPPGVGMGQQPPVFLKPGDTIRLEVEGLGVQQQTVRAYRQAVPAL